MAQLPSKQVCPLCGEGGSGFIFPEMGCWDIHATDGSASGDVWLLVK